MQKNLLSRLKRLEVAAGEHHLNSLAALSDEELDSQIESLARKLGYKWPMSNEELKSQIELLKAELQEDLQLEKDVRTR